MQFLIWTQCEAWCAERDVLIDGTGSALQAPFHTVEFILPSDAEEKVWLARFLFSLIDPSPEVLLWVDESDVGSVGRHLPVITTSGHEAFYVSHNAYAWFASRDPAGAARARHQIATAFAIDEVVEAT
jgi:hypothetical protein